MQLDSDFVLIGTGLAPLVASQLLLRAGKRVLLLNPDFDFFREESEIALDPLWNLPSTEALVKRIKNSSPESIRKILSPEFPGAVETWHQRDTGAVGFKDASAPFIRARSRLWINERPLWGSEEDLYLHASESGLQPQILDSLAAATKFPGFSGRESEEIRGLLLPDVCDVDVGRYQRGVLEFLNEKMGDGRVFVSVSQIEPTPDGIRFYASSDIRNAKVSEGIIAFWTPFLTEWISSLLDRVADPARLLKHMPVGLRIWEHWTLVSREALSPNVVGAFENMLVWASLEGSPAQSPKLDHLSVLRAGPLLFWKEKRTPQLGGHWVSEDSLSSLSRLCNEFLGWDKFSVRSMIPRWILEWPSDLESRSIPLQHPRLDFRIVTHADGPVSEIVATIQETLENRV